MKDFSIKALALFLIVFGEILCVYPEMIAAHSNKEATESFGASFMKFFFIYAISGIFLVGGYILGYRAFRNIWIVVEPFLAYSIFRELSTKGATIGLTLGGLGLVATLM